MPKRSRDGRVIVRYRTYNTRNASTQTPRWSRARRVLRNYVRRRRYKKRATAKSNFRAIQKLKREKENKWHYTLVSNWGVSEVSPTVQNLVQVPVSTGPSDVNGRIGDQLTAKYINIHGKLYYRGNQSDPSRVTILLVRSVQDNGSVLTAPTFANLFDIGSLGASGLPSTSAFRLINDEALTKVKILKRLDFNMAPSNAAYTATVTGTQFALPKQTAFPNVIHWKLEHKCMDAKLTYVSGTATPQNAHYWCMIISDDAGTSPNTGPYVSYISKFRFSDSGG